MIASPRASPVVELDAPLPCPSVTIVIPVKAWNPYLAESVSHCLRLEYPAPVEIVVLPDAPCPAPDPRVRIMPTGVVNPAIKRAVALRQTHGELLAFLDDDAYPPPDWLRRAARHFQDPRVAAVGGPGVTPPDDSPRQQASGAVYASWLVSGPHRLRYLPEAARDVDDLPSCNFIVRRAVLDALQAAEVNFWPGEDTLLCEGIIRRLRQRIRYDPQVLVYHHRRAVFGAHCRQVGRYAVHRGYFVKRFGGNSNKLTYWLPSAFLVSLVVGALASTWIPGGWRLYGGLLGVYGALLFGEGVRTRDPRLTLLVPCGIGATHLVYGLGFLKGLLLKRLWEES